ncbi:MAG: hypothetical protein DRI57_02990 [Deltaproteobacteria bacterium]|nr:MAG: hypothetical protein DRI57_02990 [Deltaproteobacteria bacterium]
MPAFPHTGHGRRVNGNMIYIFPLFSVFSHKNDHFYLTVKGWVFIFFSKVSFLSIYDISVKPIYVFES